MSAPLPRRIIVAFLTLCLAFLSVLVAVDGLRQSALAGPPDKANQSSARGAPAGEKNANTQGNKNSKNDSKSASPGQAGNGQGQAKGQASKKKNDAPASAVSRSGWPRWTRS
jgi:hypothetical protein